MPCGGGLDEQAACQAGDPEAGLDPFGVLSSPFQKDSPNRPESIRCIRRYLNVPHMVILSPWGAQRKPTSSGCKDSDALPLGDCDAPAPEPPSGDASALVASRRHLRKTVYEYIYICFFFKRELLKHKIHQSISVQNLTFSKQVCAFAVGCTC